MKLSLVALAVAVALGSGCSGGRGSSGWGDVKITRTSTPVPVRESGPCGSINGYPVQCVKTERQAIDDAMREASSGSRASFSFASSSAASAVSIEVPQISVAAPAGSTGVDPARADFQYRSFGTWNDLSSAGGFSAWSRGATTPAHAVPTTGSASFVGRLAGVHAAPSGASAAASADLAIDANFSTRSLGFTSRNTVAGGSPAPHLNLGGTLTYARGSRSFEGTLTSAGGSLQGTSKGSFYGPRAEEVGGVFSLKGQGGTFTGAYGAKR